MNNNDGWNQFVKSSSSDEESIILTKPEEVIAIALMYHHLREWFLVSPSNSDSFWFGSASASTPPSSAPASPTFLLDGELVSLASNLVPQTTMNDPSSLIVPSCHIVKRILEKCAPNILEFVKISSYEQDDIATRLPESLPSLREFIDLFLRDSPSALIRPKMKPLDETVVSEMVTLYTRLSSDLRVINFPVPPVHIPHTAAVPFFPEGLDTLHARYSAVHQMNCWLTTLETSDVDSLPKELVESVHVVRQLYLIREWFNKPLVRELHGTSHLHQLYKALYPKESWTDYSNQPLNQSLISLNEGFQRMFKYMVPEPNYNVVNVSTYQPYFSKQDMPNFKSHHWGQRKLLLTEILYFSVLIQKLGCVVLYIIYAGAAPSDHILFLSKLFPNFHFLLVDPERWNDDFVKIDPRLGKANFSNKGPTVVINEKITVYHQFFTDDLARKLRKELDGKMICFISDIRPTNIDAKSSGIEEREETILENMEMQKRWYQILKQGDGETEGDPNCWAMFKFRPSFTQPIFQYLSGQLFYQPWAPLKSAELRLITNSLQTRFYNSRWLEQHLIWYNEIKRNTKQSPSDRRFNDLWDTQFEHDIIELYRTGGCALGTASSFDMMKKISEHLNNRDMYHRKYCFEAGYEVSPSVREGWINKMISKVKQFYSIEEQIETNFSVVEHIYKVCIFRPPSTVPAESRAGWEKKKKRELMRIIGLYCYDHIKYDLIRNWLARHHLLQTEGITKEHETRRAHARVNEMNKMLDQIDSSFQSKKVLDFGGNKGFIASVFAEEHHLERQNVVVTDIDSWYGHEREKPFSNVTYLTLNNQRLPLPSGEFDTVFVLMVLHHIRDFTFTIKELRRVMTKGGLLFLREHDTQTIEDKNAVDIEHSTYELVQHTKTKVEALHYLADYEGFYQPIEEWVRVFESNGFEKVDANYESPSGWTRYVLRVFRAV